MIYAIVVVLVLIADQAMKFWTTKNILLGAVGDACADLIPGVVHITNVHNYGAAFSILQNARWALILVTVIFVAAIIVLISREVIHTPFGRWTSVLVMAGAIGNCIDRILYGYVVDMFEFEFFSFPVFNVADIFITVCGILFCIHLILHNEPEAVKAANEPEFLRRRREEKKAKEAPYAAIPHRGEHKSLEEEIGTFDPEDPFGEWEFGKEIHDPKPAEESPNPVEAALKKASAEKAVLSGEPAQKTEAFAEKDDLFSSFLFDPETPEEEEALPADDETPEQQPPESADTPDDTAEPAAEPSEPEPAETPAFSLEDILAEFGDL